MANITNSAAKHTLHIDCSNAITITAVTSVDSLTDKQCNVTASDCRLVIKGDNLTMFKLDSDEGIAILHSSGINSINYSHGGKLQLRRLFS